MTFDLDPRPEKPPANRDSVIGCALFMGVIALAWLVVLTVVVIL